jgi:hypothetical protein
MLKTFSFILFIALIALACPMDDAGAGTPLYIKRNPDGSIVNPVKPNATPKPRSVIVANPDTQKENTKPSLFVKSDRPGSGKGLNLLPVPAQNYQAAVAAVEQSMGMGGCLQQEAQELVRLERQMHEINNELANGNFSREDVISNPNINKRMTYLHMKCGAVRTAGRSAKNR